VWNNRHRHRPRLKTHSVLYFAYGSNLDQQQMRERCPESRPLARAILPGYRLAFTRFSGDRLGGVADVRSQPGSSVWGALYDISERDLIQLDDYEGYCGSGEANLYDRIDVAVWLGGQADRIVEAFAYQIADPSSMHIPPSAYYLGIIVAGARQWGLPEQYIQQIASVAQA
jgi:gamma-glutamylcyclotransferase